MPFVTGRLGVNLRLCLLVSYPLPRLTHTMSLIPLKAPLVPLPITTPSPSPLGNYYLNINTTYSFCLLLKFTYLLSVPAIKLSHFQTHPSNLCLVTRSRVHQPRFCVSVPAVPLNLARRTARENLQSEEGRDLLLPASFLLAPFTPNVTLIMPLPHPPTLSQLQCLPAVVAASSL